MGKSELSRMNDYFARYLLGQRGNEDILLNFINSVMRDNDLEEFESVTVTNPYNLKEHASETETIVDVKAVTASGEKVIIEVQVRGNKTFFDRVLEYWARGYRAERVKTEAGGEVRRFVPVISINIVAFTVFDDIDFAHTSHMIHCVQNKKVTSKKLEIHFLEIPKMHTLVKEDELKAWLSYFGSSDFENEKESIAMQGEVFKKAVGDYEYFRADNELVSEYEKRENYLNGQSAMLNYERQEGLKQGLEQGAHEKALEVARTALQEGLDVSVIEKLTNLSEDEIKAIGK